MIGLIKVIPAPISSDWSYKSQIRKNDLLQILCFEKTEIFFPANTPNFNFFPKFTQFSSDWSYSSRSRTKFFRVIGLITTHVSGLITPPVPLKFVNLNLYTASSLSAFSLFEEYQIFGSPKWW